jgi:hypothetical protein
MSYKEYPYVCPSIQHLLSKCHLCTVHAIISTNNKYKHIYLMYIYVLIIRVWQ